MKSREFKDLAYGHFARISKALSSPKRFELLDYLSQGPKTVEKLSAETGMSVANTSKHLQALLDAKLVTFTKVKNYVYYSVADDLVIEMLLSVKNLAETKYIDLTTAKKDYLERDENVHTVHLEEIFEQINKGEVFLIDVRPREEFDNQHIPGAISLPLQSIEDGLTLLPKGKRIIAYCRGPYCLYATQAVEKLLDFGYEAYRMEEGVNEWRQYEMLH